MDVDALKAAYAALMEAEKELFEVEEIRISAAIARETAYMEAINEAAADGISDPNRQNQRAQRVTKDLLTTLHQAECLSRIAQHRYKQAGILVDSRNRQIQLLQLLTERSK